jgi:hypothetical protein
VPTKRRTNPNDIRINTPTDPRPDLNDARDGLRLVHLAVAVAVVAVARHYYPTQTAAILIAAGLVLIAPGVDWIVDPRTKELGQSIGVLATLTGIAVVWPWDGYGYLIPVPLLAGWCTVTIGFRHSLASAGRLFRPFEHFHQAWVGRRKGAQVRRALAVHDPKQTRRRLFRRRQKNSDLSAKDTRIIDAGHDDYIRSVGLPPGTTWVDQGRNESGRWRQVRIPDRPVGWNWRDTQQAHARVARIGPDEVTVDQSRTDASLWTIQEHTRTPFARIPTAPEPDDGSLVLAYNEACEPVLLDITGDDAQHVLIAGGTRSGKTRFLQWLILQWQAKDARLWLVDPKGGAALGRFRHQAERWATTNGTSLLAELVTIMHDRYRQMYERDIDLWDQEWIVLVIDELAHVTAGDKEASEHMLTLLQMAAQARIAVLAATQSPRADVVGGGAAKAQFPVRFAFRLENGEENAIALWKGAKGDGWDATQIDRTSKGRCIATGIPEVGTIELQTWLPTLPARPVRSIRSSEEPSDPIPSDREGPAKCVSSDVGSDRMQPTDRAVLDALDPPAFQTALAARLGLSTSTVDSALGRLLRAGLVTKTSAGYIRTPAA